MKFLWLNYHDDFNLLSNGSEKKNVCMCIERNQEHSKMMKCNKSRKKM